MGYCIGGTYLAISSMTCMGDASPTSASTIALALDIEITMKWFRLLELQTTITLLSSRKNESKRGHKV